MDFSSFLRLELPDGESGDAAVFDQNGTFVKAGHREECELEAIEIHGLYCWIIRGNVFVRMDFEDTDGYEDEDQS